MAGRSVRVAFLALIVFAMFAVLPTGAQKAGLHWWSAGTALAASGSGKGGESGGKGSGKDSDSGGSEGSESGDSSGKGSGGDSSGKGGGGDDSGGEDGADSGDSRDATRNADDGEAERGSGGRRGKTVNRYVKALSSYGKVAGKTSSASRIEVRYVDGWREVVSRKRYTLFDPRDRRVVDRAATPSDYDRLLSAGP